MGDGLNTIALPKRRRCFNEDMGGTRKEWSTKIYIKLSSHTTGHSWGWLPTSYLEWVVPSSNANTHSQWLPSGIGKRSSWKLYMLAWVYKKHSWIWCINIPFFAMSSWLTSIQAYLTKWGQCQHSTQSFAKKHQYPPEPQWLICHCWQLLLLQFHLYAPASKNSSLLTGRIQLIINILTSFLCRIIGNVVLDQEFYCWTLFKIQVRHLPLISNLKKQRYTLHAFTLIILAASSMIRALSIPDNLLHFRYAEWALFMAASTSSSPQGIISHSTRPGNRTQGEVHAFNTFLQGPFVSTFFWSVSTLN